MPPASQSAVPSSAPMIELLSRRRRAGADEDIAGLVAAARDGGEAAWAELIARHDRLLRQVARSHRLGESDVDDAVQATWIALYRHLEDLRDGATVVAWLVTTIRRECLRSLARGTHEISTGEVDERRPDDCDPAVELIAAEQRAVLARSLAVLPSRHRELIELLMSDECADYREISARLDMPVGSIGPIRARCLARLARDTQLRAYRGGPRRPTLVACAS